ncbi:hypothetical protein [Paenibacillus spongiae]|uniref:Uncharacterized protein n=1 Tax=Paenibacillus spongiae TaxID=2909671 RepID=A0ABY5SDZ2_9BACL|nr:hypothetical protein [Paenibacillus spongiae]UVI30987.1 hypothetical protein L1F29_03740 [Paenibacillus spongiae]
MKKRPIKIRYIVLIAILIGATAPFIIWFLTPKTNLDMVVINKTFPAVSNASGTTTELDYSKQRGLFWLASYLRIHNPATDKAYDGKKDYHGNFLSDGKLVGRPLEKAEHVPDLIYISDAYGTGNSRVNGVEPKGISGLTVDEISFITTSYAKGATVIGEYNIAGDPTKPNVSKELEDLFGVRFTGWAGKFFSDLSSTEDVPNWIRMIYEQQYGKEWRLTGGGIVIAGNDRILILQRGKDFTKQSIQLSMSEEQAKAYNTETIDYYNWFEIVEPTDEESVIASYDLNVTKAGEEQLKRLGLNSKFPAIIANQTGNKSSYYFAGDFSDYKEPEKIKVFKGAAALYRMFSVKSEGDNTYFYWNFYVPLMSKVLKDIEPMDGSVKFKAETATAQDGTRLVSKIANNKLAVYQDGAWNDLYVKGVNIGNALPGTAEGSFPDEPTLYMQWLEEIGAMNANAIRVYTLMPAGFYRALDIYNSNHPDKKLYFFQNISPSSEPPSGNFLDKGYNEAYGKEAEDIINAIHGNARLSIDDGQDADLYRNDVSGYMLGYFVDPGLSPSHVMATDAANPSFKYIGEYVSSGANATPTESWLASVSDAIYQYEQTNYKMQHPAAIVSIPELDTLNHVKSNPIRLDDAVAVDMNHIDISSKAISGFFGAYNIYPDRPGFMTGDTDLAKPAYAGYKQYLNDLMKTQKKYPVLISEFGLSTSMGASEIAATGYRDGQHSESQQGEGIVAMLDIIRESGSMGGLIYEWADGWGKSSRFTSSLMIPYKQGSRWHNRIDPAQNYGILALESEAPKEYAMTLHASDPLQSIAYASDESFFYITAAFSKLPDFNKKNMMIYLDTVDRKNGEYMLAPDVNENWSGTEFSIHIRNQQEAELLVVPDYNASKGSYFTSVSTSGIFERMVRKLSDEYKTAAGETIPAKYEDGSALIPGSFEESGSQFYFEGNTLYVRIPWARLNFTDPSSLLVLNDDKNKGLIENAKDTLTVRMTDGIVASLVIMDRATLQVDYHFPESVTSSGYRTFTWNTWEVPHYVSRHKKSYDMIQAYFGGGEQ